MAPPSTLFLLPASLLAFVSQTVTATQNFPTAIKKQSPDSNDKILADHLAFAPFLHVGPAIGGAALLDDGETLLLNHSARFYPPFVKHFDESEESVLRRAAEALALLEKRAACPSGMSSCSGSADAPNKCCQEGTYCTSVPDASVGHVACCPNGSTCGGGIGNCPSSAASCAASLGGGCCIPGFICQGVGCVPSASATPEPPVITSHTHETVTSTKITVIGGSPTTVVVTVTRTATPEVTTRTTTKVVTPSETEATTTTTATDDATKSVVGNPPWRPTGGSSDMTTTEETATTSDTQTGCPTGFYGCLATHGGGCCRTDRDCQTYSCPAPSSTTIVSDGVTVVVAATDLPSPTAKSTCAEGWFMCGKDAGPSAGCCPSGYSCGTASCYTSGPTETGKVQKKPPGKSLAARSQAVSPIAWAAMAAACAFVNAML